MCSGARVIFERDLGLPVELDGNEGWLTHCRCCCDKDCAQWREDFVDDISLGFPHVLLLGGPSGNPNDFH